MIPVSNPDRCDTGSGAAGDFPAALARALQSATKPAAKVAAVRVLLAERPPPPEVISVDAAGHRVCALALARILSRLPLAAVGSSISKLVHVLLFLELTPAEKLHAVHLLTITPGGQRP